MGKKRSSLKEPRWHRRGNEEEKLHPMSIKYWINLDMLMWVAYDNTYEDSSGSIETRIDGKADEEITAKMFEQHLKYKLQWEGQNYFDRGEYDMRKESPRYRVAEKLVKRLYPKWFRSNAKNFIME